MTRPALKPGPVRLLITGSRSWRNYVRLRNILYDMRDARDVCGVDGLDVTLVSGACPTGADRMCEIVAEQIGWRVERHPAKWRVDGVFNPAAGFERNALMVGLGADLCFAFSMPCTKKDCDIDKVHPSHGTQHAITEAHAAHIPLWVIEA